MFVVTDVTSKVGAAVALKLLKSGLTVRGIGKKREEMAFLKSEGMEVVTGEMDDPAFLHEVFKNADTVLLSAPLHQNSNDFRNDFRSFGESCKHALQDSTVKNVFFISSMGTEQSTEAGLILGLRDVEKALNHLNSANIVFFHPGYYMDHLLKKIGTIKSSDMISDSTDGQTPLYMVSSEDIVNNIVTMYKQNAFYGHSIVELYGDCLSYRQATRIIGHSIGIPELLYKQLLDSEMRNELINLNFSINMADAYVEMTHALSRGAVSPNLIDRNVPNCPTRFKQYVETVFVPAYDTAKRI